MLAIALMLLFAGAAASKIVDRIQHMDGARAVHAHMLFSEYSVEEVDHVVHHPLDGGSEHPGPDPASGNGHHHHADAASGVIVLASAALPPPPFPSTRIGLPPARAVIGAVTRGLERPPKAISTLSA